MLEPKPTRESLSKTPSWIMLGVIIGSIVTVTVQKHWGGRNDESPPIPAPAAGPAGETSKEPAITNTHLSLFAMETLFQQYQENVVWRHEIKEVVFWNPFTDQYSEYVEVLRNGEDFYFRSIPRLTRPIIEELMDPNVPMRFTEPESVRAERRPQYSLPGR